MWMSPLSPVGVRASPAGEERVLPHTYPRVSFSCSDQGVAMVTPEDMADRHTNVRLQCRFDQSYELVGLYAEGRKSLSELATWEPDNLTDIPTRLALFVAWSLWWANKHGRSLEDVPLAQKLDHGDGGEAIRDLISNRNDPPVMLGGYLGMKGERLKWKKCHAQWATLEVTVGCANNSCTPAKCNECTGSNFGCTNGSEVRGSNWEHLEELLRHHEILSPAGRVLAEAHRSLVLDLVKQLRSSISNAYFADVLKTASPESTAVAAWFCDALDQTQLLRHGLRLIRRFQKSDPERAIVRRIVLSAATQFYQEQPAHRAFLELHATVEDHREHKQMYHQDAIARPALYRRSEHGQTVPRGPLDVGNYLEEGPDLQRRVSQMSDNLVRRSTPALQRARGKLLKDLPGQANYGGQANQENIALVEHLRTRFEWRGEKHYLSFDEGDNEAEYVAKELTRICTTQDSQSYIRTFALPLVKDGRTGVEDAALLAMILFEAPEQEHTP